MPKFDPLAYIESAFLDARPSGTSAREDASGGDLSLPHLGSYLGGEYPRIKRARLRKTAMRAPRPRRRGLAAAHGLDPTLREAVESLPRSVEFLLAEYDDGVTARSYGEFRESRKDLVRRLLDPVLSLEETARLLGVCPATVRRYTNRGWLSHHRTEGGQRRFRLSDVSRFVHEHARLPVGERVGGK